MIPAQFLHVGVNCQDPAAYEKFYTRHFGFTRTRVVPLEEGQIVFLTSGALTLEIFQAAEKTPLPRAEKDGYPHPGLKHLAFTVDDVDAKLEEMGDDARVTLGPLALEGFIPGWKAVWIADPEGNIVELTQGYADQDDPPSLPE